MSHEAAVNALTDKLSASIGSRFEAAFDRLADMLVD